VHQPIAELGARAAAGALGDDIRSHTVLPTRLVVRESCGCAPETTPEAMPD